jgi:hypothetical protein
MRLQMTTVVQRGIGDTMFEPSMQLGALVLSKYPTNSSQVQEKREHKVGWTDVLQTSEAHQGLAASLVPPSRQCPWMAAQTVIHPMPLGV